MTPEERLQKATEEIEALNTRADELLGKAENGDQPVQEVKDLIEKEIKPSITALEEDRDRALEAKALQDLQSEVTTVKEAIESLKLPEGFTLGEAAPEGKASDDENPYESGEFSLFGDIKLANKGVSEARERLDKGIKFHDGYKRSPEGKALTEGTPAQGGYLVQPQIERQIVLAREADNVLRSLCSVLNVNTNAIQLDQIGYATTAGWVAELATKPENISFTLATLTASVFTAAGLATISNQLLADSSPAVDQLVTSDLTKRLVALEEAAFLAGTGTGQPLGLLNTPGLGATPLTSTVVTDLLDAILTAIGSVESSWGAPTAILMHPRTWTRILTSKDAQGAYYISPAAPGESAVTGARTVQRGPQKFLWGYPVVTSNRVPTNLGAGTDESRVIVGDFRECLILDRQGITVDESPHVYFTSNQTVFRAETRVGFTAARTPSALNVIGGVGLKNG